MRSNVIVIDPPWSFGDALTMSSVKRGAASNYNTMSVDDICALPIKDIANPDGCILALWVPSSLLAEGLSVMNSFGFTQKQSYIWVKSKKPSSLTTIIKKDLRSLLDKSTTTNIKASLKYLAFDVGDWLLGIGLGRLFRQSHEICLIGTNNTGIYKKLEDKSQRSVCFASNLKHSAKPENLQNSLDIMFPGEDINRVEIFARRQRPGWVSIGNQAPMSNGEDIRVSIDKLKRMKKSDEERLIGFLQDEDYIGLKTKWEMI